MNKTKLKIGDIFSVKISKNKKKYFQYIAIDKSMLGSDVIRGFKKAYDVKLNPSLEEIIANEVAFYAHCMVQWGIKFGFWEKIGSSKEVGSLQVIFRDCDDYGEPAIKVSKNWRVWQINEERIKIGKLNKKYSNAEFGLVFSPNQIVSRIKTGKYIDLGYPK